MLLLYHTLSGCTTKFYYLKALSIHRDSNDLAGISNALDNLANVYRLEGRVREAIIYYQEALDIAEGIGTLEPQGNHWHNMAAAYLVLGDRLDGLTCCLKALSIRGFLEDPNIASTRNRIKAVSANTPDADWASLYSAAESLANNPL